MDVTWLQLFFGLFSESLSWGLLQNLVVAKVFGVQKGIRKT